MKKERWVLNTIVLKMTNQDQKYLYGKFTNSSYGDQLIKGQVGQGIQINNWVSEVRWSILSLGLREMLSLTERKRPVKKITFSFHMCILGFSVLGAHHWLLFSSEYEHMSVSSLSIVGDKIMQSFLTVCEYFDGEVISCSWFSTCITKIEFSVLVLLISAGTIL